MFDNIKAALRDLDGGKILGVFDLIMAKIDFKFLKNFVITLIDDILEALGGILRLGRDFLFGTINWIIGWF